MHRRKGGKWNTRPGWGPRSAELRWGEWSSFKVQAAQAPLRKRWGDGPTRRASRLRAPRCLRELEGQVRLWLGRTSERGTSRSWVRPKRQRNQASGMGHPLQTPAFTPMKWGSTVRSCTYIWLRFLKHHIASEWSARNRQPCWEGTAIIQERGTASREKAKVLKISWTWVYGKIWGKEEA